MQDKLLKAEKDMPNATIRNSIVSIILAIVVTAFTLARTSLTTQAFGVDSLGLLTVVIGILPYLSSSHGGLTSVSTSKLYNDVYMGNHEIVSQKIADLKAQYYLFGMFYFVLTLVIAFSFPFIISPDGVIVTETTNIAWYESTLFILSNSAELFAIYFIVPISVILLFIDKKAYISNMYTILFTVVLNLLIITLYVLILNNVINLSFIMMNIIVFLILGSKMCWVLGVLYFYRKKYFPWYQKKKISSFKITKNSLLSVGSEYLNQFGTDLTAIVFIIYAALNTSQLGFALQHSDGGSGGNSSFVPSAIYAAYLLILTSGNEIVHSIVDASIPSLAEHVTFNDTKKINKHIFHRYQVLSVYIGLFTVTSFIFISGIGQSIFLHSGGESAAVNNYLNIFLICLLWLPALVDVFNGMYTHLLPIFGNFNSLFKITLTKSIVNLVILGIMITCFFCTSEGTFLMNGIFGSIIASNLIANGVAYIMSRKIINKSIFQDGCVNTWMSTLLCNLWVIISLVIMIPIYIVCNHQISHLVDEIGMIHVSLICIAIIVANFFISILWIYWFRRVDFTFYSKEIRNTFAHSKA